MLKRPSATSIVSAVLLLTALAIAPVLGGGLGELASGLLQILVLTAIALRLLSRGEENSWKRVPGWWFLIAFAALAILSTVFSRAIYYSLNQILFLSACLGGFVLAATLCRDRRMAAAALWALVLSALFVSGAGVRGYILDAGGGAGFWKHLTSGGAQARLFGPFINPNFFAGYLVIALPVTLAAYLTARRALVAILPAAAFVFEVMALTLTGAKFGVIAAGAALFVFLLLTVWGRAFDRARLIRLVVLALIVGALLVPFSMPVKNRVQEAQSGGTQVHSTAFRIYTWKATLNMIKAQPILGVGPGVYGVTYPQYTIAGPTKFSHNSYLQLAAEMGVPALIAFVLLLLAVAWRALRGMRERTEDDEHEESASESVTWTDFIPSGARWRTVNCGLFAALFGSSIRSLVDSDWYIIGIALPFWIAAGMLVSRYGAGERDLSAGRLLRPVLVVACLLLMVLSVTFGIGDRCASLANAGPASGGRSDELWEKASAWSPLNPEYHRQEGLWLGLAMVEPERAYKQIDTAIRLARNTSEGGWKARGMVAISQRDWPLAISSLKTALKFNPNSTDTISLLAAAYQGSGQIGSYEAILRRLLAVEKSPYEQIKGTPELIDTTYAFAHAYFGRKALDRKDYASAITEFEAAVDRLELWRASGDMRKLQQYMGMSNELEDQRRLDLLRECYRGLVDSYYATGREADVDKALAKMQRVK